MTFKLPALLVILSFLFSCNSGDESDSVVLKIILPKEQGELSANNYLYLVDVSKQSVVDSALVSGDTVIFTQTWTPAFVPHMVSVRRMDAVQGCPYLRPMGIKNPYLAKTINSSFYLDKGTTILKPFLTGLSTEQTDFSGSKQNEPFFKQVALQFPEEKSAGREAVIQKNISRIKFYPYSIYLLEQLFRYKEKFLNEDLKNQLSYFDSDIKKTPLFKSFTEYFATSASYDKGFPAIKFESGDGSYQKVGNDSAAYYLVVYWASWCGPCRKEIPDIKGLYNKYKDKGLAITSISIDGEKRNWQKALLEEKMPWQQLIAIDSSKTYIDLHYDMKAIPKAYLFNRKKELVKIFDDGDGVLMANHISSMF